MIEAFLSLLTLGCIVMSVRLTLVTRRLKKAEATLQQVVSVVAMADPEMFKQLEAKPQDSRVDDLVASLEAVSPHDREDALRGLLLQNPWLDQQQFNRLLQLVPGHSRGDALITYTRFHRQGTGT